MLFGTPRLPTPTRLPQRWQATLNDYVSALAWSPDGALLAAAEVSGPLALFESGSGARRYDLPGHTVGTTMVAWHPDGNVLSSAGQDGAIRFWDTATGAACRHLEGGAAWVEHLAWTPGGRTSPPLLASAAGRTLRVWDGQGTLVDAYPKQPRTITAIQWVPGLGADENGPPLLAMATYDAIRFWVPGQPEPVIQLEQCGGVIALAWRPDRRVIAAGKQDAGIQIWPLIEGSDLLMRGYATKVRELAWDHTSRFLASGGGSAVIVWDWAHGSPEGSTPIYLEAHLDDIRALAFQHAGPLLASGGTDGRVYLWWPETSDLPLAVARLDGEVSAIAWSPDDRALALSTAAGTIHVCNVDARQSDGVARE